jgi:hypothetical protein
MRLVLHIGTHKTGTTALQKFLASNSGFLKGHGLYYATPPSKTLANTIADALNDRNDHVVRKFFQTQIERARRQEATTAIVSAENFYGMTPLAMLHGKLIYDDVISRERNLIARLRTLIPSEIETTNIACYFRRPDRFAESFYNQHVKGSALFAGDFQEFLAVVGPMLRYNNNMNLWQEAFGRENCVVRTYEATKGDIVSHFMAEVLGLSEIPSAPGGHSRDNERMGRDLLEFKRLINCRRRRAEKPVEYRIFSLLDQVLRSRADEPDAFQDFLSPRQRSALLEFLGPEMTALQATYNLMPFPIFDERAAATAWQPYPGLSLQRRQEINRHYELVSNRLELRVERFARKLAALVQ